VEKYLNKGVKEVISKFPEVGNILSEADIGCVSCALGSCLLKDIVGVHNLSADEEKVLLARIANVIFPDKKVEIPAINSNAKPKTKELKYSPPVKKLVEEHTYIKKLLSLIPQLTAKADLNKDDDIALLRRCIDFIRNYADKYHHAKEEDVLFKYFDENSEIIKSMNEDHKTGRNFVKNAVHGIDVKNKKLIEDNLLSYRALLTEHIKKEDEILYPWMDRELSLSQVGEMFSRFREVDERFKDIQKEYEDFVVSLENN